MPTYDFPRPALTADVAAFRGAPGHREVLLIRRGSPPFEQSWALPGGFVEENEPLASAALRELIEETGLEPLNDLAEVGTYGDPGRDPRGWTVTVLYAVTLGDEESGAVAGGDDADDAAWYPVGELPALAFDHALLVADALNKVSFGL
ncbi:MAG: NUDIX hydrolase [Coriobacteriia bacterium]|nr:NUDIX hydrolase [Coriobacteriia bacterium]